MPNCIHRKRFVPLTGFVSSVKTTTIKTQFENSEIPHIAKSARVLMEQIMSKKKRILLKIIALHGFRVFQFFELHSLTSSEGSQSCPKDFVGGVSIKRLHKF